MPASGSRFVVRNATRGVGGNGWSLYDVAEERRRPGVVTRERGRQTESRMRGVGMPINFVSGNGDEVMPPDYHQTTQPSTSRAS